MTTWADLFERSPGGVTVEAVCDALADRRSGGKGESRESEGGDDE